MASTKGKSTNSSASSTLSSSSNEGRQPTIKELREWYSKNEKRMSDYANTIENVKRLNNLTIDRNNKKSILTYTKEKVVKFLREPAKEERGLRDISRYLFFRSHVYYRIIDFFVNHFMLDAYTVIPKRDLNQKLNKDKMLKSYRQTLQLMDRLQLKRHFKKVLTSVFRDDIFYGVYWVTDEGLIIIPIDPDYGKISAIHDYGFYTWAMDMTWFRSRQDILEFWGEPFKSLYEKSLQRGESKYQDIPIENGVCFKFRTDYEYIIPPFSGIFLPLLNLEELENLESINDEMSVLKLVYQKLKPISGSANSDDWEVTEEIAEKYFEILVQNALPEYVAAALIPGTDDLGVIDFSNNDAASETNKITKATEALLNISGGAEVLSGATITSSASIKAAQIANTRFALTSVLPQIEGWCQCLLDQRIADASKVKFFMQSPYTKQEFMENLLSGAQNGLPNALAYNSFNELTEYDTLCLLDLQEALEIPDRLIPLSTSYTQSGNSEGGRPTVDDDEISESGDRTRNA